MNKNGWQVKALGEVARLIRGVTYDNSQVSKIPVKNYIPLFRANNINDGLLFDDLVYVPPFLVKEDQLIRNGDILIAMSSGSKHIVGKTTQAKSDLHFSFGAFCGLLRPSELVASKYLGYYFRTKNYRTYISQSSRGANINNLRKESFERIKIPLPPLPIQKQIAEILEKADEAKQKRSEANKLTDEFLQSVFIEMFGDPGSNPKGWGIKKVKSLVAIPLQNGAYFTKDKYTDRGDEGVEMVHMADAFYKTVQTGGLKKVIVDESEKVKYELRNNDILIARRSLTIEGAAQACLVKVENTPLIFESSFIRIRVNEDILSPVFIFHFLSNDRARKAYVQKYITSSTISGINQSNLAEVDILIPPLSLQLQFTEIVTKTETLKEKQKQSEQELENLFQSLMQKAFKGELV